MLLQGRAMGRQWWFDCGLGMVSENNALGGSQCELHALPGVVIIDSCTCHFVYIPQTQPKMCFGKSHGTCLQVKHVELGAQISKSLAISEPIRISACIVRAATSRCTWQWILTATGESLLLSWSWHCLHLEKNKGSNTSDCTSRSDSSRFGSLLPRCARISPRKSGR